MAFFSEKIGPMIAQDRLVGCRVRDTTDPDNPAIGFVREVYMLGFSDEHADFIEMFVSTQTFQAYIEESFFG